MRSTELQNILCVDGSKFRGVSFASKGKMSARAKELVDDQLVGEYGPFLSRNIIRKKEKKCELHLTMYVVSLWDKVHAMLDKHERYNHT